MAQAERRHPADDQQDQVSGAGKDPAFAVREFELRIAAEFLEGQPPSLQRQRDVDRPIAFQEHTLFDRDRLTLADGIELGANDRLRDIIRLALRAPKLLRRRRGLQVAGDTRRAFTGPLRGASPEFLGDLPSGCFRPDRFRRLQTSNSR